MRERQVSLKQRKEDIRDKNEIEYTSVQFGLEEIRSHFLDSLSDIDRQLSLADSLISDEREAEAKDIWRSQIVYAEGVMDFYLQELSKYAVVRMFRGMWSKTEGYRNLQIPMKTVEEGLKSPESTSWLFERLSARFSYEVYLSPDAIGKQLSLIGMKLDDICRAVEPPAEGESYLTGQQKLRMLYSRRNQIAHQSDRKHSTARKEDISRDFVITSTDFIRRFVEAVHSEALSMDKTEITN